MQVVAQDSSIAGTKASGHGCHHVAIKHDPTLQSREVGGPLKVILEKLSGIAVVIAIN